jgi:hypothetical protein
MESERAAACSAALCLNHSAILSTIERNMPFQQEEPVPLRQLQRNGKELQIEVIDPPELSVALGKRINSLAEIAYFTHQFFVVPV